MKLSHSLLLIGALAAGMVGGGWLSAQVYLSDMYLVTRRQQEAVYRLAIRDTAPFVLGAQGLLVAGVVALKGKDIERDIVKRYLKRTDIQKGLSGSTVTDLQAHFLVEEGKR